jgi:hypothetical protein
MQKPVIQLVFEELGINYEHNQAEAPNTESVYFI